MKTMVVLSGGMDSATLLYKMREQGAVEAVTFDYSQRHVREIRAARDLAAAAGVVNHIIDLRSLGRRLTGSSQTDMRVPVPEGRYDEPSMKQTVVPNRNMFLLASAGALAIARGCEGLAYGAHSGDHAIYPDCRESFIVHMRNLLRIANWEPLHLLTPFVKMHKGEIAALGRDLCVPFELTWTCYAGGEHPCGKCGACVERAEAFEFAGISDPLVAGAG